ncbi:hypothetical protein [Pseudomonas mohnii]
MKKPSVSSNESLSDMDLALLQLQWQVIENITLIIESGDDVGCIEELQIRAQEYVEIADSGRMPLSSYARDKIRMNFQSICEQIEDFQFQLLKGSCLGGQLYR